MEHHTVSLLGSAEEIKLGILLLQMETDLSNLFKQVTRATVLCQK